MIDPADAPSLDREIEAELADDDSAAVRALLASDRPVHIRRAATSPGHVVRLHPDGLEEVLLVARGALAPLLGW